MWREAARVTDCPLAGCRAAFEGGARREVKDPAGIDYSHFENRQKIDKKSLVRRVVLFPGTYRRSIPTFMWVNSPWWQHEDQSVPVLLQASFRLKSLNGPNWQDHQISIPKTIEIHSL